MRRLSVVLCVAAAGAVALIPAAGSAAAPSCEGTTHAVGPFYIDDRDVMEGGVWLYEESNGAADLQRGGTSLLGEADPCADDTASPDTLIF